MRRELCGLGTVLLYAVWMRWSRPRPPSVVLADSALPWLLLGIRDPSLLPRLRRVCEWNSCKFINFFDERGAVTTKGSKAYPWRAVLVLHCGLLVRRQIDATSKHVRFLLRCPFDCSDDLKRITVDFPACADVTFPDKPVVLRCFFNCAGTRNGTGIPLIMGPQPRRRWCPISFVGVLESIAQTSHDLIEDGGELPWRLSLHFRVSYAAVGRS